MPPHSLNLKQKLSALSLAQSAPSSPNPNYGRPSRGGNSTDAYANNTNGSYLSATAKRKMFLHAPSWMKKPHGFRSHHQRGEHVYGDEEMRLVQEVLGQMIFQAGVDYECVVGLLSFLRT
jgi:Rho GTPase-activating protein 1